MRLLCIATLLLCFTPVAAAQSSAATQVAPVAPPAASTSLPPITDMDVVAVSGMQPGPGMWRVSKGDHVLWVMGTLSPVPKKMVWISRDVEATIAASQLVMKSPGASVDSDLGVFRSALLIPSLFKARKNPDGGTLKDVLPPDLYARWQVLKLKYIGRDAGIEKWRPIFAANELYEAAVKKSGLATSGIVSPVVDKAAKRHDVKIVSPIVRLKVEDPKKAIKEFSGTALGDVECFRKTLDRLETDLTGMTLRANAWAIGDIEALRELPYDDQNRACIRAMLEASVAQKRGLDTLPQKIEAEWLATAENALRDNTSTFALLPISELLKPDGYLAKLQAKGYEVVAP